MVGGLDGFYVSSIYILGTLVKNGKKLELMTCDRKYTIKTKSSKFLFWTLVSEEIEYLDSLDEYKEIIRNNALEFIDSNLYQSVEIWSIPSLDNKFYFNKLWKDNKMD